MTSSTPNSGGAFTLRGTSITLNRIGFGASQLCGPMVYGPPADKNAALAVVRGVVELGVNHIDTSDYYGPHIANHILREALSPYGEKLAIVTKVGARRGEDKSWPAALSAKELRDAVRDNLANLGLEKLSAVNLRVGEWMGPNEASIEEPLAVLAEMKSEGLIEHIGLSNVSPRQYEQSKAITDIVCVQNHYNLAHRVDDDFIDALAAEGVAYVPFFPLGGFRPIKSPALDRVAEALASTPRQVAMAWLLRRASNILLIVGTSSLEHMRQNLKAAELTLTADMMAELDAIAASARRRESATAVYETIASKSGRDST